jgi:hypothetical protein
MFEYSIQVGSLYFSPGSGVACPSRCEGYGYSGFHEGKNNPDMEDVHDVGPIPRGDYAIGAPFDSPTHGPLAIPLTPLSRTQTFGRSGFLMHGDSIEHPGEASHGCIIMPHYVREHVAAVRGLLRVI